MPYPNGLVASSYPNTIKKPGMACNPPTAAVSIPYCILAIATAEHIRRHLRFAHSVDLSRDSIAFIGIQNKHAKDDTVGNDSGSYQVLNMPRLHRPIRYYSMSHGLWGEEKADRYSALEMCISTSQMERRYPPLAPVKALLCCGTCTRFLMVHLTVTSRTDNNGVSLWSKNAKRNCI
jgi:hypothetical protein